MPNVLEVYQSASVKLSDQVAALGTDELALAVPATPEWTVRDVLAHLTSIATGLAEGDYPSSWFLNIGRPDAVSALNAWTDRMVETRRSRDVATLVDEWQTSVVKLRRMVNGETSRPPGIPAFVDYVLVTDLTAHQYDINGALQLREHRDAPGIRIGTSFYLSGLQVWQPQLPSLTIDVGDKSYTCGSGAVATTLTTDRFTLFRCLSGRRSPDQIRSLDWDGDPDPFLDMFAPYGTRDQALEE